MRKTQNVEPAAEFVQQVVIFLSDTYARILFFKDDFAPSAPAHDVNDGRLLTVIA